MGSMPQTDIVNLLARSSIFVFPAIHDSSGDSDNLPTVLIEAMASNLPVIATDIAGIPEIVQQNKNGILVQEKDAAHLANAIRVLACNQGLLEQYGSMSRRIAAEKFALANTVAELKSLFSRFYLVR
jgi:glycosyltransferase involved in cell wall biosynthesis